MLVGRAQVAEGYGWLAVGKCQFTAAGTAQLQGGNVRRRRGGEPAEAASGHGQHVAGLVLAEPEGVVAVDGVRG